MKYLWLILPGVSLLCLWQTARRRMENYPPPFRRWTDMPDPRTNSPPAPMMYGPDREEDEPPVGCDHDFPLEAEVDDDEEG